MPRSQTSSRPARLMSRCARPRCFRPSQFLLRSAERSAGGPRRESSSYTSGSRSATQRCRARPTRVARMMRARSSGSWGVRAGEVGAYFSLAPRAALPALETGCDSGRGRRAGEFGLRVVVGYGKWTPPRTGDAIPSKLACRGKCKPRSQCGHTCQKRRL